MKALFAFIVMAVLILALIEINERIKAKKGREEDCQKENPEQDDCSGCGLLEVCDKKPAKH